MLASTKLLIVLGIIVLLFGRASEKLSAKQSANFGMPPHPTRHPVGVKPISRTK
jgi:hypothetical protein